MIEEGQIKRHRGLRAYIYPEGDRSPPDAFTHRDDRIRTMSEEIWGRQARTEAERPIRRLFVTMIQSKNYGEAGVGKSPLCSHRNKDWMRCTPSMNAKSREKF